jgi:putative ABC transport system permease protein
MRLFRHFILRPLISEKIRTVTTVLGVALGIAVVIAIQLTNASSVRGFETALETVAGKTAIEIIGTGAGVEEDLVPQLSWLREYGIISPVIEGSAAIVVGDPRALSRRQMEAVKVLGIDILRDQPFRDYQLLEIEQASRLAGQQASGIRDFNTQQFLEILTSPQTVVITEKLATRRNYALGSSMRLMIGDRILDFVVRGILKNEGPARVLDGNFIMMDIAAAQLAFDRLGRVDRLDVLLPEGADLDGDLEAIAARLPAGVSAQRPSRRSQQVETMLAAFHANLTALSWIALIVGLFLVYNTVTISVVARRQEIGTLRALGLTRTKVLMLFLGEAAALAVAGIAIGLGLARLLADAAVTMTASTVSTLYIAAVSAPPDMNINHVWVAMAIGLPLSLIAAAIPALEASRVPPPSRSRSCRRSAGGRCSATCRRSQS